MLILVVLQSQKLCCQQKDNKMAITKSWNLPTSARSKPAAGNWIAPFPNPADLNFNYRKLLDNSPKGIGDMSGITRATRVTIVGAGIAGLTAARELLRSGITDIDICEATGRYGGRHYTQTIADANGKTQFTVQEGGAMRMPPFLSGNDTDPADGASILSYFLNEFKITTEPFPNPGSAVAETGIYYNDGYASGQKVPSMLYWPKGQVLPPSDALKAVYAKWQTFVDRITNNVKDVYPTAGWQDYWQSIVRNYWDKTFRDVVMLPPITGQEDNQNWGGCGMTEEEATLFYTIGAGDGSWGAFFNLSFLYAYRTFVHGFSSDLQLIQGLFDTEGNFKPGPAYGNDALVDSIGNPLPSPNYLGVGCFDDCILFEPIDILGVGTMSMYEFANRGKSVNTPGLNLFFNTPVTILAKRVYETNPAVYVTSLIGTKIRDAVILTVPTWQTQMSMQINGFDTTTEWPFDLQTYLKRAHWEPCCKIFVGLTEAYWEDKDCKIPQIIATDSFLQDIYGVKVSRGTSGQQSGTLLLSYTWWRDANKLVSYSDSELIDLAVDEADRILLNCENIGQPISPYIIKDGGYVIHWERMPTYKGAARLYDERTWNDTQVPMAYNQEYSRNSAIYFAGEAYSVDAGWTEPALRGAIDAVLHICKNWSVPIITEDFNFDTDYPKYDLNFDPAKG